MAVNDRIPQTERGGKPAIRAVFFDIGNVLLRFDVRKVVRALAAECGCSSWRIAAMVWKVADEVERGRMPAEEVFRRLQGIGFRSGWPRFRRIWCDQFRLERAVAAMLTRIASERKVYLLSNTHALHYEWIVERYAFPRQVHGAVLSHEVRRRKPEPGIYRAALRLAGVRPAESVFIDDMKANVAAARALGMNAIRFRGAPELRREFQALGVL